MELNRDLPMLAAGDCPPCEFCEEPWCTECGTHYADCAHPGPGSDFEDYDDDD